MPARIIGVAPLRLLERDRGFEIVGLDTFIIVRFIVDPEPRTTNARNKKVDSFHLVKNEHILAYIMESSNYGIQNSFNVSVFQNDLWNVLYLAYPVQ